MIDAVGPRASVTHVVDVPRTHPRKKGSQRLPVLSPPTIPASGSALPSRRALNLPGVQTTGADLDLGDLSIDHDSGDLEIGLPGAAGLVVRVRDVVAVGDAFVADVAAVSLDLRH